jgi:hypothetical protein
MNDLLKDAGIPLAKEYAYSNAFEPQLLTYTKRDIENINLDEEIVITIRRKRVRFIPIYPPLAVGDAVPV